MAAYKVINLDSPIESDYWVDIPVRDPATNKDAVDEKGRILVERHVTRSVKNEEMSTINAAVETVNTLKEDYSTFKEEVSTKVNTHDSSILTNTNNITTLTDSVTNHDLQINALYTKINAIQGIDIDDFKYVTETDIKNIKNSYLPLVGGTLTGNVSIQTPNTAVLTLTPKGSSSYASLSINNNVLDCTTTWGKVFKVSEEGKYFYGLVDKAIADKNNNDITTTYATKTENTSNLASAKAYADAKKNEAVTEAITSANSYTDREKAKYLPLLGGKLSGPVEIIGSTYEVSVGAYNNTQGSLYLYANARVKGMYALNANRTSGFSVMEVGPSSTTFIGNLQGNAATANEATNAYNLRATSHADHFIRSEWDNSYFWTWVRAPNGEYRPVRVERANSAGYADHAITADRATNATNASHATKADSATNATNANHATNADHAGIADSATKAIQDGNGAQIDTTYFKSANGTFTGGNYYRDVNNSVLRFNGGNTYNGGASLMLFGKNAENSQGVFDLVACSKDDASDNKQLIGTPAGSLTWAGHEVERVELKNGNYIRFTSGLTLMWGEFGLPEGTKKYTVNLPIPFKSSYQAFLSNLGSNDNFSINYRVSKTSLSTFEIQHTLGGQTGWSYFAVGY